MYAVAKWARENCHLQLTETILSLGHGFGETGEPVFTSWPPPCLQLQGPTVYGPEILA
jgi:hypothetical protein